MLRFGMDNSKLIEEIVIFLYNRGFISEGSVQLKEILEKVLPELQKSAPLLRFSITELEEQLIQFKLIRSKNQSDGSCEFDLAKVLNLRKNIIEKLDAELQIKVQNSSDFEPEIEKLSLLDFMEKDLIFQFNARQVPLRVSSLSCFYCLAQFKSYHTLWKHIESHIGRAVTLKRYCGTQPKFLIKYTPNENSFWRISITGLTGERLKVTNIYLIDIGKPYLKVNLSLDVESDVHHIYIKNKYSNTNYEFPLIIVYEVGRSRYMEMHNFPKVQRVAMETLKVEDVLPEYLPSSAAKSMHEGKSAEGLKPNVLNYINNQQILTDVNIYDVFTLLVEMDDWAAIKAYAKLSFKSVPILESKLAETDDEYEYYFELHRKPNADPISQMLSIGDQVILKDPTDGQETFGTISRFIKDAIYFNVETHLTIKKYDISFVPQRLKIQYQHKALDYLRHHERLRKRLFPVSLGSVLPSIKRDCRLTFFNSSLAKNPEQSEAVQNIVDNTNKEVPFILFGPPGTGKTTVIVEALLQLSRGTRGAKILVAAGSNAACDEIAIRLAKYFDVNELRSHIMLRIYAKSCERSSINDKIRPVSNLIRGKQYYPSLENIYRYDIVIATLTVVGRLVHGNISENHFTDVFIDECGSTMEPESLLAICGVLSSTSNLILAGDPKQLGPIIQCRKAASYGLERSLLERLLERDCYKVDSDTLEYNKLIQMRLVRNYRSHPSILSLPNMLYYDNQLKALATSEVSSKGIGWPALPTKTFPVVFKSVNGSMKQIQNLPRYYAPAGEPINHYRPYLNWTEPTTFDILVSIASLTPRRLDYQLVMNPKIQVTVPEVEFSRRRENIDLNVELTIASYYNQEEIEMVMTYVKDLMFYGILNQKVVQEDIGIISPYKRQCNFLRKELDKRGWYAITTGSVETFQGQEKPIIIASTVRSRVKTPGFLDNPKRLNVLLTRAQSLLIIVGNSRTLYKIGDWRYLIDYCVQNQAFLGDLKRFKAVKKPASTGLVQAMETLSASTSGLLVDSSDSDTDESEQNGPIDLVKLIKHALNLQKN